MTQALAEAGLEVHVATTDDNGLERLDVPCGVPLVDQGVVYNFFRRQQRPYTFSWPITPWLAHHVRAFDLVHIHGLFSYVVLPAAFWAGRLGVPYIVRPLGALCTWGMQYRRPRLKRLSLRLIERRVLAGSARVHYTSEQERSEAHELGIRSPSVVVPLGLDIEALHFERSDPNTFGSYLRREKRPTILYLGRLDPKKGLELLIGALPSVVREHPDALLVLAGSGNGAYEAWLRGETARLGLDPHVLWAGFLEGDQKAAAFARADVLVLPSRSENFGLSVIEGLARGVPVIVSNQVAICRELEAASAGIVVSCDAGSVARGISKVLGDPELQCRLCEAGRLLARECFSKEAMTVGVLRMYQEVLESKPVRG
jgi:glycosyltransferase involved in cell wall biosynthesis